MKHASVMMSDEEAENTIKMLRAMKEGHGASTLETWEFLEEFDSSLTFRYVELETASDTEKKRFSQLKAKFFSSTY